eukprot:9698207-Lingulodinium_polyedra.AAC.1
MQASCTAHSKVIQNSFNSHSRFIVLGKSVSEAQNAHELRSTVRPGRRPTGLAHWKRNIAPNVSLAPRCVSMRCSSEERPAQQ